MYVSWGTYRFIDARNFVPPNINLTKFAKMWKVTGIEKEIFPYDWFDSFEKLQSPCLPPRSEFKSQLNPDNLPTQKEYKKAVELFTNKFTTFQQYEEFYCERDVDLLIQSMNNYRQLFWSTSKLEILNCVSLPQLAYTDLLKTYIKHPLEYIPNRQVFDVINESVYGGNCQVFQKYAHVDQGLIFSVDENNLYGHSMSQLLPYGPMEFYEMNSEKCKQVFRNLTNISQHPEKHGWYSEKTLHWKGDGVPEDPYEFNGFLRVHLHFTEEQKTKLQYFPPLPNKRTVKKNEMSPFMIQQIQKLKEHGVDKTQSEKMVYDLND